MAAVASFRGLPRRLAPVPLAGASTERTGLEDALSFLRQVIPSLFGQLQYARPVNAPGLWSRGKSKAVSTGILIGVDVQDVEPIARYRLTTAHMRPVVPTITLHRLAFPPGNGSVPAIGGWTSHH